MTPQARGPVDTIFILHPSEAGTGLSQVLQPFTEDMSLDCVCALGRALSLLEATSSLKEPGLWTRTGGHGKVPETWF